MIPDWIEAVAHHMAVLPIAMLVAAMLRLHMRPRREDAWVAWAIALAWFADGLAGTLASQGVPNWWVIDLLPPLQCAAIVWATVPRRGIAGLAAASMTGVTGCLAYAQVPPPLSGSEVLFYSITVIAALTYIRDRLLKIGVAVYFGLTLLPSLWLNASFSGDQFDEAWYTYQSVRLLGVLIVSMAMLGLSRRTMKWNHGLQN